jgi:hypothetical protein
MEHYGAILCHDFFYPVSKFEINILEVSPSFVHKPSLELLRI